MALCQSLDILRHNAAVAAGQTLITPSAGVDTAGYDGVVFIAMFGTIDATAVTSIEAHTSSDDGVADAYTALIGTNVAVAADDDNTYAVLEIVRPKERYVKCLVNRGTADATLDGIVAIRYGARVMPTTLTAASVANSEVHFSPAEGAA